MAVLSDNNDINALRKKIDSFGVEVIFPDELQNDQNATVCCNSILNLLPRLLSTVRYTGPSSVLKSFLPSHVSKINVGTGSWNPSLTIVFGKKKLNQENVLYVGSAGWSCYLSSKNPCLWPVAQFNILSSLYAAGLAVGEVFKQLMFEVPSCKISHLEYDLITHGKEKQPLLEPMLPDSIHFDDLTIVGCGAIGQALVFALKGVSRLWGMITLVDPDKLEPSNEQRYIGAFEEHRGLHKTQILSEWLAQINPGLRVLSVPQKYENYADFEKPLGSEVIVAVDNEKTRLNVQAGLPKILWNVWTDISKNTLRYGAGYHVLNNEYQCVACGYFPETMPTPNQMDLNAIRTGFTVDEIKQKLESNAIVSSQDLTQIIQKTGASEAFLKPNLGKSFHELLHGDCGVFRIPFFESPVVTPAPHTSFLAGVFLASQIVLQRLKLPTTAKLMESISDFDAFGIPNEQCLMKKQKHPKCFCDDPIYQESYKEKWNL